MQVTPFKQGEPKTFVTLLCDGYLVSDAHSMQALIDVLKQLAAAHPNCRLMSTLDDFGQACYTSGHATDIHDLDSAEGHDLSGVDSAAFENGAHIGYLTTKSEFFIRRKNLSQKAATTTFADLRGKLFWGYDGQNKDFFELNANPDAVLDKVAYLQIVPVEHAHETICAFPNGYFSDDLTPMDIFALAKHFEERFGYALFGIGASYLGFMREAELSEPRAHALAADILSLYRDAPKDAALRARVASTLDGAQFVLINYTAN